MGGVDLPRRLAAEGLGTALLLATIVGSGIMGERLADGNDAVALLANSLATGAALVVLILVFGPISGAHFNPVVSLADAWRGEQRWSAACLYAATQLAGALLGVAIANLMFDEPAFTASRHVREGAGQWLGEFVATFGLLVTIFGCRRARPDAVPYAVGLYITAAYWFTSSTSFANPAVSIARAFTDTFAGIRPRDAPAFIVAQLVGAAAAVLVYSWLVADRSPAARRAAKERGASVVSGARSAE